MKADYAEIVVESYQPHSTAGKHGLIHIRPIDGQGIFKPEMNVECSKKLSEEYPVGTSVTLLWLKLVIILQILLLLESGGLGGVKN
jgi:hypothetical protein